MMGGIYFYREPLMAWWNANEDKVEEFVEQVQHKPNFVRMKEGFLGQVHKAKEELTHLQHMIPRETIIDDSISLAGADLIY